MRTAAPLLSLLAFVLCHCSNGNEPSLDASFAGAGAGGAAGASAGGGTATSGSGGASGKGANGGVGAFGGTLASGGANGGAPVAGAANATGGSAANGGDGDPAGGSSSGARGGVGGAGAHATGGAGQSGNGGTGNAGGGNAGSGGSAPNCGPATSLKEAASCRGVLIGTALTTRHLQEAAYAEKALEFNYVTPEDEMKWANTEPTRNQFRFTEADQVVDFALDNDMKVKGHTLVWYNQLPAWVSEITGADELRSVMVTHIERVMQHYRGKVVAWDVVNEAWSDDDPTQLRDSVFSGILGRSYIEDAFKAARAADPDAKLFYNDYATDGLSAKANSVYEMVRDLKERNVPIDGVGLQMHWRSVGSSLTAAEVSQNLQRLADLGVEVVISEMDVQLCRGGTLEDQKARFHDIVAACLGQPKCTAVTFWGITDKYSWLNDLDLGCTGAERPRPLLWDDAYAKKPAYDGVMDALLAR